MPTPPAGAAEDLQVQTLSASAMRCSTSLPITEFPKTLEGLPCVTVARGDSGAPAPGFAFTVDKPVTVYLAVHDRGDAGLPAGWENTDMRIRWKVGGGGTNTDTVYRKDFPAGKVEIPGHQGKAGQYFGIPNMAIVGGKDGAAVKVSTAAN